MLSINKYGNFKSIGKQKKKTQIVLCHTSREADNYLASLKFRYNGQFDRIPHFVITNTGEVLQLLPETRYSRYFGEQSVDKNSIFVCFENLGWLEKKPLSNEYINWQGSIYKEQVYEKKWRDYFFWDPYKAVQIEVAAKLCNQLTDTLQMEKKCIGHNTKIEGISKFEGISSKSNYDQRFTDLNPSFNFETFIKFIENEQFA